MDYTMEVDGYWIDKSGEVHKCDVGLKTHSTWILYNFNKIKKYLSKEDILEFKTIKNTFLKRNGLYNIQYDFLEALSIIMMQDGWVRINHFNKRWLVVYGEKSSLSYVGEFLRGKLQKNDYITLAHVSQINNYNPKTKNIDYEEFEENGIEASIIQPKITIDK